MKIYVEIHRVITKKIINTYITKKAIELEEKYIMIKYA